MAIDIQDQELLSQLAQSIKSLGALEVSEATVPWCKSAMALLQSAHAEFEAMVDQEHREESEAHGAMAQMEQARRELDALFVDILAALDVMLGQHQLSHKAHDTNHVEVTHFVNRYHAGEFEALRDVQALHVVREASGHLALCLDEDLKSRLAQQLDDVVFRLKSARMSAVNEGSEAVDAYGDLLEGRSIARVCYLTARDLVSAALRFEDRHEELDGVMPPMRDVITVGVVF